MRRQIRSTSKGWLLLILLVFSIAINLFFRLNSLFLPYFDQTAKLEVYNNFENELRKNLALRYPDISGVTDEKSFNVLFKEYIKENKPAVDEAIYKKTQELQGYYRDEQGWPYLLETDSYRWLRRVENFIHTGNFGTSRINNNVEIDDLMFAPNGARVEPLRLHFYTSFYIYKLMHLLNNKLSLMSCLSFQPVLISTVMLACVFLVCNLTGISYLGSFIASLIIGLSGLVLMRTSFAWLDTDVYNLLFPLAIISTLACAFKQENLKYYFYLALSGLLIGIYSGFWSIWWLVFYILLLGIFVFRLEILIYNKYASTPQRWKDFFIGILIFTGCAYLSVLLISGTDAVIKSVREPFSYLSIRQGLTLDNFWPDLSFTVGELKRSGIEEIVSLTGGSFMLYGGIIGLLLFFISQLKQQYHNEKRFLFFALFIWLVAMLGMTHFGVRFMLFLIIPIGIAMGLLWDFLNSFLFQKQTKLLFFNKVNIKVKFLIAAVLFIFICLQPIYNATRLRIFSFMNDTVWGAMLKIKEITPKDAVIQTTWDLGDYIMTIANRATINDPSWQYTPIPYWFNRALLSEDEQEALSILRMLNSGGNNAFEELTKALGNDKTKAMEVMNKIFLLKAPQTQNLLSSYKIDKDRIDRILNLLQGSTRPAYLLVHYRMVDALPNSGSVGSWDFNRLDLWQNFSKLKNKDFIAYAKDRFNYTQEQAQDIRSSFGLMDKSQIFNWITKEHYEFYTPYSQKQFEPEQKLILFDNGLAIDKENLKAYYKGWASEQWIIPRYLIFAGKTGIKENSDAKGDAAYSALLYQKDDATYRATLFSSSLRKSLFFKLFFTDGRDLKYFSLVYHESNKDGANNIYLYKINL